MVAEWSLVLLWKNTYEIDSIHRFTYNNVLLTHGIKKTAKPLGSYSLSENIKITCTQHSLHATHYTQFLFYPLTFNPLTTLMRLSVLLQGLKKLKPGRLHNLFKVTDPVSDRPEHEPRPTRCQSLCFSNASTAPTPSRNQTPETETLHFGSNQTGGNKNVFDTRKK